MNEIQTLFNKAKEYGDSEENGFVRSVFPTGRKNYELFAFKDLI